MRIGDTVIYMLTHADAARINQRREDYKKFNVLVAASTDTMGDHGNYAYEGDMHPAILVRSFSSNDQWNIQVLLDGNDTFWATSVSQSEFPEKGHWAVR